MGLEEDNQHLHCNPTQSATHIVKALDNLPIIPNFVLKKYLCKKIPRNKYYPLLGIQQPRNFHGNKRRQKTTQQLTSLVWRDFPYKTFLMVNCIKKN
jgi:hypothetical protein